MAARTSDVPASSYAAGARPHRECGVGATGRLGVHTQRVRVLLRPVGAMSTWVARTAQAVRGRPARPERAAARSGLNCLRCARPRRPTSWSPRRRTSPVRRHPVTGAATPSDVPPEVRRGGRRSVGRPPRSSRAPRRPTAKPDSAVEPRRGDREGCPRTTSVTRVNEDEDAPRRRARPPSTRSPGWPGVSRATASRAINGGQRVSPRAQSSVDAAVRSLGYVPNPAARSLVTRRTDSIAVVVPEPDDRVFSDPFFAGTLRGVTRVARRPRPPARAAARQPGRVDRPDRCATSPTGTSTAPLVVSHHRDDGLAEQLARTDLPCVFGGRPWTAGDRVAYVDVDNTAGERDRHRGADRARLPAHRHHRRAAAT